MCTGDATGHPNTRCDTDSPSESLRVEITSRLRMSKEVVMQVDLTLYRNTKEQDEESTQELG